MVFYMKTYWAKIYRQKLELSILSLIILLILSLIGYITLPDKKPPTSFQNQSNQSRDRWLKSLADQGPQQAYQELKQQYLADPFTGHQQAHIFGELLYQSLGFDGIKVCDNSLGFGCFHGLIIAAINHQGINSIYKIDQVCIDKYGPLGLGCQHGIGHGIMEYLGLTKLPEALELCHSLTWKGKLLGCQSGALMEYISPNSLGSTPQSTQNLFLTLTQPLGPCPNLSAQFQMACYYEMRRWWDSIYHHNFYQMSKICDSLDQDQLIKVCLMGVGYTIAEDNQFNFEKTIQRCNLLDKGLNRNYCFYGLNWAFKDNNYLDLAEKSCKLLDPSLNQACHLESDLTKY